MDDLESNLAKSLSGSGTGIPGLCATGLAADGTSAILHIPQNACFFFGLFLKIQ